MPQRKAFETSAGVGSGQKLHRRWPIWRDEAYSGFLAVYRLAAHPQAQQKAHNQDLYIIGARRVLQLVKQSLGFSHKLSKHDLVPIESRHSSWFVVQKSEADPWHQTTMRLNLIAKACVQAVFSDTAHRKCHRALGQQARAETLLRLILGILAPNHKTRIAPG